ncbi:MAG: hypothetical protein J6A77_06700 [Lachnospiraceae bacterium]|nr:hypothetical protein [Lachnospiraceae bacterium]
MAKGNKIPASNRGGNNRKDYINSVMESARAKKEKTAAEKEESAKQEAMSTMTEEEKQLFMSQEEILAKEKEVAEREKKLEKSLEDLETRTKEAMEAQTKEEERLKSERDALEKKKGEYADKEKNLSEREKEIVSDEKKIADERKKLDKRQSDLNSQERNLIERENNAEAGFIAQNQRSLESLRKSQENLQGEILELQEKKISAETELQEELQRIREQKLAQMEQEMEAYKKSVLAQVDAEVKVVKASAEEALERERALLKETQRSLEKEREEVNKQKNEQDKVQRQIADSNADIEAREMLLNEDRNDFDAKVKSEVNKQVQSTLFELGQAKEDITRLKNRLSSAQNEIAGYKERERAADGASAEELLQRITELEQEKKDLESELASRPKDEQLIAYQTKAEKYDKTLRECNNKEIELEKLRRELDKHTQFEIMLADARQELEIYKRRIEVKELMLQKYSEEVDKFKSLYNQPKELESRLNSVFDHEFDTVEYAEFAPDYTEMDWLENIYDKCIRSEVIFNKRLLKSFHTSLKTAGWSPLTVLAGVSGTGKSLLPEYYCRYGGIYFKSMAVQPDWDSPQSLFGFFNSIDNRFNATTLTCAMVQFVDYKRLEASVKKILKEARSEEEVVAYLQKLAVEKYNLNNAMFMVLLDEMNLAHVELYFSDMLSKLEKRRNSDEAVNVELDMGAEMSKFPLELSDNILWVGTMNEDETTKSLSDKVLDRGNLISFPRPTEFKSRKKIKFESAAKMLKKSIWSKWVESNVIENPDFNQSIDKYRESLQRVNGFLGHAGRALGHRVWQSIENYMANHPDVINAFAAAKADQKERDKCMQRAFEEALVHKVMPKLRGIETDGDLRKKCIDPIKEELFGKTGLAKGLEKDFNNALDNPYETFLWCSAEYLDIEE